MQSKPKKEGEKDLYNSAETNLLIRISGPQIPKGKILLEDLSIIANALHISLERLALKEVEGIRSLRRGRRPTPVKTHIQLYLRSIEEGSTTLGFDLIQSQFDLAGEKIGTAILEEWVKGIQHLQNPIITMPEIFDRGVLSGINMLHPLFNRGIDEIEFSWQKDGSVLKANYTPVIAKRIETLMLGPSKNLRTISGVVLKADFHTPESEFNLYTQEGIIVCTASEELLGTVLNSILHHVRITGEATIDPETDKIKKLKANNIEIRGEIGISDLPLGLIRDFWAETELNELIDRQMVMPYKSDEELAWEPPTEEEMERYLEIIKKKERKVDYAKSG